MRAITHPGFAPSSAAMRTTALTEEEKQEWIRWQKDHARKVSEILLFDNIHKEVEAHAWLILEEFIMVHERGYRLSSINANKKLKCSKRLEAGIQAIKHHAIMRFNVLEDLSVENFAANPNTFAGRKESNLWVNLKKKRKKHASDNQTEAEEGGAEADVEEGGSTADQMEVGKKRKSKGLGTTGSAMKKRYTVEERKKMNRARKASEKKTQDQAGAIVQQDQDEQDHATIMNNGGDQGMEGEFIDEADGVAEGSNDETQLSFSAANSNLQATDFNSQWDRVVRVGQGNFKTPGYTRTSADKRE